MMRFNVKNPYYFAGSAFLAVILTAGIYWYFWSGHPELLRVEATDIVDEISATGRVATSSAIDLSFGAGGRIAKINAKEGERVAAGDVAARLETGGLEAKLKQYQAKAEVDRLKLIQLLSGARVEEVALAESKVESAEAALERARNELDGVKIKTQNDLSDQYALARDYADTVLLYADNAVKALAGVYTEQNKFRDIFIVPDSQKKSEAEWQVMFAKTAYANIKDAYDSLKLSNSQKDVDQALSQFKINLEIIRSALRKTSEILDETTMAFGAPDIGAYKTTMAVQRSNINSAQTTILTMEQDIKAAKEATQTETGRAEQEVKQAQLALKTAEDELALKRVFPGDLDLKMAQAQVKEDEARIALLKEEISGSEIKAPVSGLVTRIYKRGGASVKADESVLALASFSDVQIETFLGQAEAGMVRPGDPASVRIGNIGKEGKVVAVSGQTALIYMQDAAEKIGQGVEVNVKIRATVERDVIFVPADYVFDEDGMKKVLIWDGGVGKPLVVITGEASGGRIRIKEGLSDGDTIVK